MVSCKLMYQVVTTSRSQVVLEGGGGGCIYSSLRSWGSACMPDSLWPVIDSLFNVQHVSEIFSKTI